MGTRNCLSCMFASKSCHIRVAIDTAAEITFFRPTFSSARADTTFDEWTYARVFIHIHFLERFPNQCVSVNTLSLSRVDTVIYCSGSPQDASHLPSRYSILRLVILVPPFRVFTMQSFFDYTFTSRNQQSRKYLIGRSYKNDEFDWLFCMVIVTCKTTDIFLHKGILCGRRVIINSIYYAIFHRFINCLSLLYNPTPHGVSFMQITSRSSASFTYS